MQSGGVRHGSNLVRCRARYQPVLQKNLGSPGQGLVACWAGLVQGCNGVPVLQQRHVHVGSVTDSGADARYRDKYELTLGVPVTEEAQRSLQKARGTWCQHRHPEASLECAEHPS